MKTQTRRILCLIAVMTTLLFSTGGFGVLASQPNAKSDPPLTAVDAKPVAVASASKDGGKQVYIVKFSDAPLATYDPAGESIAVAPFASGGKLDVNSPESQAYLSKLEVKQDTFLTTASAEVGRELSYMYTYKAVYNGAALELTAVEAEALAQMPGVVSVQPDFVREIQTDNGPEWIGADSMWTDGYKGEDMLIGMIDTGINPLNPSFADVGGDGYDHPIYDPDGDSTANTFGVCDPTSGITSTVTFDCNDKLVGAYDMTGEFYPVDVDGHGSHTASTAGGNVVMTATINAPTTTITREISGVAPHAHLVTYRACGDSGCPGTALIAAIEQAVLDGVDAINYSIGADTPAHPWGDADADAFLDARAAGIFVATSAGNAGPGYATVGTPANAPWVTAVGNSTHDRTFLNSLTNLADDGGAGPADITGKSLTAAYGPAPIVYAGDYGDPLCGTAFTAGTWSGQIVVCDRGTYGRVAKGENVLAGGAGGYVLANDSASGAALVADGHALPAVHITYADGVTLKNWMASATNPVATIAGTYLYENAAIGDNMAASSSRGVNEAVPGVIKPDVTAPGTDIFAAYGVDGEIKWDMISGTSMASPHIAGAGTLLAQAHPDWTPSEIQSALMLTGQNVMKKEDGTTDADPFDMGGGRAQVGEADAVGFVLDETITNFEDADPNTGGDPTTLNLASLGNSQCVEECVWTRTISSTQSSTVNYTASTSDPAFAVSPTSFALAPGAMQTIVVTATTASLTLDDWAFGTVDFAPDDVNVSDAHFTIAVMPTAGSVPEVARMNVGRDAGSKLYEGLEMNGDPLGTTVFGSRATIVTGTVTEDPSNTDVYGDVSQVWYDTFSVPADALYVALELLDTTAPDLDLFVGYDSNSDGIPQEGEEIGNSASGGSAESVFFNAAALEDAVGSGVYAAGGTYWVLVQNWDASSAGGTDPFTLAIATVDAGDAIAGESILSLEASDSVYVEVPTTTVVGTPFDARVYYNLPGFEAWYGIVQFDDNGTYQLEMPIQIVRGEDDVIRELMDMVSDGTTITATFGITVAGNSVGEDLSYLITETLPAALSFVPGSATGGAIISGDTLTWTVDSLADAGYYAMATSDSDSTNCVMPLANSGAYIDLQGYGISAQSTITGDSVLYSLGMDFTPNFFGEGQGMSLYFGDDGVTGFDLASLQAADLWANVAMPDAADPNTIMAPLWFDGQIVYDAATNKGVSLASLSSGAAKIIEWDDVVPWGGDGSVSLDYEMLMWMDVDDTPGAYEIIFAYDNINGDFSSATVGVEDSTGTNATQYGYGDVALSNGLAVCFDWVGGNELSMTYQVTTTVGGWHDITMASINDNPGAVEEGGATSYFFDLTPTAVSIFGIGKFGAFGLAAAIAVSAVVATMVVVRKRKH